MKRVLAILTAKWLLTLIGAIALSLIVWFVGPLIAIATLRPLAGEVARIIVIMVILVAWGLVNIFTRVKEAKTNEKMVATLTEAPKEGAADSAEELATLRARLEEALALLRKSSGSSRGGRYLYQLPWYMLIGPPGSGKTTALQNSGLKFPLAAKYGKDPVKGVGGTRNCDWWLTDEAVLLDTAGRYTTQDSHAAADQAAWQGFLGLLKKFRPRQPINGALVVISLADIATLPSGERLAHARAIRQRLHELSQAFVARFPVYVLVTKADLVAGFVEYFDDLRREEREQVWGMTLPMDGGGEGQTPAVAGFGAEFDTLLARLDNGVLERMQQELDLGKRALIYGFPAQMASLKAPLAEFLDEIFMPNRYEGRPLLRGVYFTSGTQEGTPVDRLMASVAATFGIDRQRLSAFSGAGRSYFLTRLLREVIFAEASVAGADLRVERRQAWLRRGAYVAAGVVLVAGIVAWTVSYFGNRALIAAEDARLARYEAAVAPLATSPVTDGDVTRVLAPLNLLRAMPAGYDSQKESTPWSRDFGLDQDRKIGSEATAAYRRALNTIFLPRLLVRLGGQIDANLGKPDYLDAALRVYLMLGSAGPLDKELVRAWMTLDWKNEFPGADKAALRTALAGHLDALLEAPLQPIALDGSVIGAARRVLLQTPLAARAYNTIAHSAAASRLPEWRISDHAGPAADRVFTRVSGKLLSDGIPGFYTYAGFHTVFLPALATVARDTARDSWVLGEAAPKGGEATVSSSLQRDILQLYDNDYIARWDALLADIAIAPFHGTQNAAEIMNILSSPTSPLKILLTAIAQETQLTRPPQAPAGGGGGTLPAAAAAATSAVNRLASVIGQAQPAAARYGQAVDDHFRRLHAFVGLGTTGPAPIDDLIRSLNDVYLQLNRMAQPGQALIGAGGGGQSAVQTLATEATRLPPPVSGLVAGIARNASGAAVGGTRTQINDDWQANVLPFCTRALADRYPIVRGSPNDATLEDFAKLFAPNGLIDAFFKNNLKPYVDTSRTVWRWQKVDNVDLGIPQEALMQFQHAAAIRDGFFSGSAATPSLKFDLLPISLDPGATQVLIDINGQEVSYAHGPPRPTPVAWPGAAGVERARIAFSPAVAGQVSSLTKTGPWSLFRLFDAAKIEPTGLPDRLRVTFTIGAHKAVWEVRADSVNNPLTLTALHEFRCPARL